MFVNITYLLKNNQLREFVKFMILCTPLTHVRDLARPGELNFPLIIL